jgi:DNA-binding NarL/FixJ family response regulator
VHATALTGVGADLKQAHDQLCRQLKARAPYPIGPIHICSLRSGVLSIDARRLLPPPALLGGRFAPSGRFRAGPLRVYLLAGDHLVRRGLGALLAEEVDLDVVGSAASAASGEILALRPHLVIVEPRPSGGSGVALFRQLRLAAPDIHGLLLIDRLDPTVADLAILAAGFDAGVDEHVLGRDLISVLRRVVGREYRRDHAAVECVLQWLHPVRPRPGRPARTVPDPLAGLTPAEQAVLAGAVEGLADDEIAARLRWSGAAVRDAFADALERLDLAVSQREPADAADRV